MRSSRFVIVVLTLLAAGKADASTDLNGLFDARSMGMGGTGVAFLDSAGVIPINPAALEQVPELTLTLNGFLFISQPEAPYRVTRRDASGALSDNYETIRSDTLYAPLFYAGGAFRIFDRVVFGVGFGPMIGQGTSVKYQPAPELRPDLFIENEAAAGLLELSNALSVRITDTLSLGAAWRITYMTQTISTPLPGRAIGGTILGPDQNPIYGDIEVTGLDLTGFQLGVFWKPSPSVRFGLSYRNKVKVEGEGTTKSRNPVDGSAIELETIQPFANPHSVRAGVAFLALEDALTFSADFKYLMYAEAWESIDVTTTRNGMTSTTSTPTKWKDAYNVYLGSEYRVTKGVHVRAGYILATSATPEAYAKAFMAPPGISHCWTAGLGFAVLDSLDLDLAGSYVVLTSKIDVATPDNAGVGIYGSHTGELSLSATYRN